MQADSSNEIKSLLLALTQQQATRFAALESEIAALRATTASNTSSSRDNDDSIITAEHNEHRSKRHTVADGEGLPMLERDELLLKLMECVGTAEWLYIASISRRWRGLYFSFCTKKRSDDEQHLMRTSWAAATTTAQKLRLAFSSGLCVSDIFDRLCSFATNVAEHSLEPIPVMTLARVRGVDWHESLCSEAAWKGDWEFLKWLHEEGCPWTLKLVYYNAMCNGIGQETMSILSWIKAQTDTPLTEDELQELIFDVGGNCDSGFVMWLRTELQAPWPDAFVGWFSCNKDVRMCWSVSAVHYALKQGSGWGAWRCQDLKRELYTAQWAKNRAEHLFDWAHEVAADYGFTCPCTCEEAEI